MLVTAARAACGGCSGHARGDRGAFAIQEARVDRRGDELRMLEQLQQERDVRANAEHREVAQGRDRPAAGDVARLAPDDQLGEHRVVVDRHFDRVP